MPRRADEHARRPALCFGCRARGLSHGAASADDLGLRPARQRLAEPGMCTRRRGLDLDHAYKAMDWLGEIDAAGRSTAEAVEEALYRHR